MDNQPDQAENELDEKTWAIRGEVISSLRSWMIADHQNRSCGEEVDFVEALEKLIDFKILEALKQLPRRVVFEPAGNDRADELARAAVHLKRQQASASRIWEFQQIAKSLVIEGKITQQQCDTILELSGGEIRRS